MPLLSKVNAGNSRVATPEWVRSLQKTCPAKIKRARPSHKPRPKATCPHPTRPLRPPGRRARHRLCTTHSTLQIRKRQCPLSRQVREGSTRQHNKSPNVMSEINTNDPHELYRRVPFSQVRNLPCLSIVGFETSADSMPTSPAPNTRNDESVRASRNIFM